MSEKTMMKCGHSANGTLMAKGGVKLEQPAPCCVICDCHELAEEAPSLEGRIAKCCYKMSCKNTAPSTDNLAFFQHHPDEEFDEYYCGCEGWD
jgi:hypothetical protein